VTRKLMEQANALDAALRALKKLVPKVGQLEDDFDFDLVDAVTKEARLKLTDLKTVASTKGRHAFSDPTPSCWRCNREMTSSARFEEDHGAEYPTQEEPSKHSDLATIDLGHDRGEQDFRDPFETRSY
jgi:hypothetical protein